MHRLCAFVLLLLSATALAGPQQPPVKDGGGGAPAAPPAPVPVVRLAPSPVAKIERALRYRLQYDQADQTPGNAAPLWARAGQSVRQVPRKLGDQEFAWTGTDVALKDLPRKEVRELLDAYRGPLQLADLAAPRERCDWDAAGATLNNLDLMLDEVQSFRELVRLLSLRCRLETAEGQFDKAVATLRTGLTLARHVGEGPLLIHYLVGIALEAIMLGRVEELIQQPGAPNLYWSLTTLPTPLIDARRSLRQESGMLYRTVPELRALQQGPVSARRAEAAAEELFQVLGKLGAGPDKPALAAYAAKHHAAAKRYLLDEGRPKQEVEGLPAHQAVVLHFLGEYDRVYDDAAKWFSVPFWQGHEGLQRLENEAKAAARRGEGYEAVQMLTPTLIKVYHAGARAERQVAGLRCAEALRLYAAGHDGKPPQKLADVTEVPLPTDPYTGKGFDAYYQFGDGKGVLNVPPPPGMPPTLGRRFELKAPDNK